MPEEKARQGTSRGKRAAKDRDPTVLPQKKPRGGDGAPTPPPPVEDREVSEEVPQPVSKAVAREDAPTSLDAHLAWPVSGGDPDLRPIIARRSAVDDTLDADVEVPEGTSSEAIEHLATLTSVMRAATAAANAESDRLDARMNLISAELDRLSDEVGALRRALHRPARDRAPLRPEEVDAIATAVVALLQESFEVVDDQ